MSTKRSDDTTSPPASVKLPYSPPVILSREPLEAVAAVCSSTEPTAKAVVGLGLCGAFRS